MKGLLVETIQAPVEIVAEATEKDGRVRVKAKLMEADVRNRNNRVYKQALIEREVGRLQERIQGKVAFGSGDHPDDGRTNFSNVSHLWDKVWTEGRDVYGEATILNTGRGRDLQEIVRVSRSLPVSARGFGSVVTAQWEGEPADIVEDTYELVTFDFVLNTQGFEDARVLAIKEEKGGPPMTLDELRAKHPDLVKAIADEAAAKKEAELTKAYEEKVLAKIGEEKAVIEEAVSKKLREEWKVDEMLAVMEQIASGVAPYVGEPRKAYANDAAAEAAKAEVAKLTADLNRLGQGLKEAQEQNAKLSADLQRAQVPGYVAEKVKALPHADLLTEALKDCATPAEVDQRLLVEQERVRRLTEKAGVPAGTGKVPPAEPGGQQLTEEQKRQQRLAGVAG